MSLMETGALAVNITFALLTLAFAGACFNAAVRDHPKWFITAGLNGITVFFSTWGAVILLAKQFAPQ